MTDAGYCVQCLCEMGFVPCREKLKWLRSSICPHPYQMRAYALLGLIDIHAIQIMAAAR